MTLSSAEDEKSTLEFIVKQMIMLDRRNFDLKEVKPAEAYCAFLKYVIRTDDNSSTNLSKLTEVLYAIEAELRKIE